MEKKNIFSHGSLGLITATLGALTGFAISCETPWGSMVLSAAQIASKLFIDLIQLISLPIIFLSIVATFAGMESLEEMKRLGKKIIKYTILTTIIAATVALILFILIDPSNAHLQLPTSGTSPLGTSSSYLQFLLSIIPDNAIKAFSDNKNVMSIVLMAGLLGTAILALPTEHRQPLKSFFGSLFAAILQITQYIIFCMPIGIWAFVTIFSYDLFCAHTANNLKQLMLYTLCIISANLIQGFVILPLFLLFRKYSPLRAFKGMYQALVLAFFSKSSNATLPVTMRCAIENLNVNRKIATITLPLCAVINMNGCAAFILTTVLFVATKAGMTFSIFELIGWVFIASLAAVGNAGVPMGCYFLASAFLVGMGIPQEYLGILFVILPIYTIIDMVETCLNVWSDSCITLIIDQEIKNSDANIST